MEEQITFSIIVPRALYEAIVREADDKMISKTAIVRLALVDRYPGVMEYNDDGDDHDAE